MSNAGRAPRATHISVTFSNTMSVLVRVVQSPVVPRSRTDVVIETDQLPCEFLATIHNDPNLRTHAFVDEFYAH
jgi:hypothetical protein